MQMNVPMSVTPSRMAPQLGVPHDSAANMHLIAVLGREAWGCVCVNFMLFRSSAEQRCVSLMNKRETELLLNQGSLLARQYYSNGSGRGVVVSKASMVTNACKLLPALIGGGCPVAELSGDQLGEALQKWPSLQAPGKGEGRRCTRWRERRLAGGCVGRMQTVGSVSQISPQLVLCHFITHLSRPRIGFSFLFLLKPCDDNYRESFERRKPSHESFNLVVFSYGLMDTYLTGFADSRSTASYLFLT